MTNFDIYLKEINRIYQSQNATEHTYRPALQNLIESLAPEIKAINEPKRIKCGAPDFVVTEGVLEIGHIEAKDIGISLKKVEKTPQMQRYLQGLGNLILTDYLEFRWYLEGELRLTAITATIDKANKLKINPEGIQEAHHLLAQFLATKVPQVTTPKALANRMASLAQLIRDAIIIALADEDRGGMLREQLESFQKVLIRDLTGEQFADMYAQTICYGLFAARCNTDKAEGFSRENAAFKLPKTNPFLRSIFGQIAGPDLDERITWAVDSLATILQQTDMAEILKDFGKRTRKEDPVVHFYETFLAAYDPKMRESRGVYYTPEPVVSYIVKSVDYLLKNKFQIPKGLADSRRVGILPAQTSPCLPPSPKGAGRDTSPPQPPSPMGEGGAILLPSPLGEGQGVRYPQHQVLILDPAVGTGTFMYGAINHIYEHFNTQEGIWSSYVTQHLLPRLFGFELLMAPYTVAHMKLGLQLQELGYDFQSNERIRIYLTNTLQEAFQIPAADGFINRIRDEAAAAKDVKQELPIMVVLGNPPYSYESINTDTWIVKLVRDYYQLDGQPLGEKNPKGLLDDYVKFIRFAQHRVSETGYGIIAFVTNHGYLDNPTFRGMRYSLMQTFDEIYVLDLHGNSKKKEVCPDGTPDKNVFDIQQGVAIGIFIKYQQSKQELATVYHADLWGMREIYENQKLVGGKYHWLAENDVNSTDWQVLKPSSPFYLFIPQNTDLLSEYQQGWKITEVMPVNSVGMVTARDKLTIHFTKNDIWETVKKFAALPVEDARQEYDLGKDTTEWTIELAQKDLKKQRIYQDNIVPILYRPFDIRYTYYTGNSKGFHSRARSEVMRHFIAGENLGFITSRQQSQKQEWSLLGVTNILMESCAISNKTREINYLFPLYLYPTDTPTLFESETSNTPGNRRPNLSPQFISELSEKLGLEFIEDGKGNQQTNCGPEDILHYIYAVFHSPTYRTRYAEFLKIDFPRMPLTSNPELFWQLVNKGAYLVQLHLMKDRGTLPEISTYPVAGSNIVEKVKYDEANERVYINLEQYFGQVASEIWNFYIGGYQVCQKWLKDRKDRELSYEDLTHYQNIISVIYETIKVMQEVDIMIEERGGFPLQ